MPTDDSHVWTLLQDDQWMELAPVLAPANARTGRPARSHWLTFEGILWVAWSPFFRHPEPAPFPNRPPSWRNMPRCYGNENSIFKQYCRWQDKGLWNELIVSQLKKLWGTEIIVPEVQQLKKDVTFLSYYAALKSQCLKNGLSIDSYEKWDAGDEIIMRTCFRSRFASLMGEYEAVFSMKDPAVRRIEVIILLVGVKDMQTNIAEVSVRRRADKS